MQIRVRLFAALRETVGAGEIDLEVADGASAGEAFATLRERFPALSAYRSTVLFAVNAAYAEAGTALHRGDELALIPPVSGGARCSS